jgi:predicted nucleic acid-binding protein
VRPADVPARPLLVDTNVVSQIVLREGRWEEFSALIGARPRYINFAVLGELATFTRLSGLAVEKRTAMIAALDDWEVLEEQMERVAWEWARLTANLDDFRLLAAADPRILLVQPD